MPSKAYAHYESRNVREVLRLLESYDDANNNERGRKALGHLTSAAVLLLCSAWERYVEMLCGEMVGYIVESSEDYRDLPRNLQETLRNSYIKHQSGDVEYVNLSSREFFTQYISYCDVQISKLNTPKTHRIQHMFVYCTGWNTSSLLGYDSSDDFVNKFVELRGAIAHGGSASYVRGHEIVDYIKRVTVLASNLDNGANDYLTAIFPKKRRPWNRMRNRV